MDHGAWRNPPVKADVAFGVGGAPEGEKAALDRLDGSTKRTSIKRAK
jgi:hypothetical protein